MNSFTNAVLLFFFIPIMGFTIFVGFNLPIDILRTSGEQLPYKILIFWTLGAMVGVISGFRSSKRWLGLYMVNQTSRFLYSQSVSKERRKRVVVYTILESLVLLAMGTALYVLTHQALPCAVFYWFFCLDNVIFIAIGYKRFRVSMSSKALLISDREVSVLYFSGLRKISISQQTFYFDYIKELQLSFPIDCIPLEARKDFVSSLDAVVDHNKVLLYNLGEWKK